MYLCICIGGAKPLVHVGIDLVIGVKHIGLDHV